MRIPRIRSAGAKGFADALIHRPAKAMEHGGQRRYDSAQSQLGSWRDLLQTKAPQHWRRSIYSFRKWIASEERVVLFNTGLG
jgi:hypothetical protein